MKKLLLALTLLTPNLKAESRFQIAVLDTGIKDEWKHHKAFCKEGHKDFTGYGLQDAHGHGTNISGIIAKQIDLDKNCLVMVKYWEYTSTVESYMKALRYIVQKGYEMVVFAGGGYMAIPGEKQLIQKMKLMVAASGNEGLNLSANCVSFPSCFYLPNVIVVGASDLVIGNKNGPVKVQELGVSQTGFGITMSGTSQASANHAARLIRRKDAAK